MDRIHLPCADIVLDAPEDTDGVIHPVTGQFLEQVHDRFAVTPGVHKESVEPGFVGGDAQPKQMAVDAFQPGYQFADGQRALGNFHLGQFFHPLTVGAGMGMRANPADTFEQVQVLDPVACFGGLFNAAMDIAQPHARAGDNLAVHRKFKVTGFLECRVLRPDRDDKFITNPAGFRRFVRFNDNGLFRFEIFSQWINTLRPIVCQEQARRVGCSDHGHTQHFAQFALEEGGHRDLIADGCNFRTICTG